VCGCNIIGDLVSLRNILQDNQMIALENKLAHHKVRAMQREHGSYRSVGLPRGPVIDQQ
jgi:hypothetical protein